MRDEWKRLKSGSDIRGVAIAEDGKAAELTEPVGRAVGQAFALWLSAKTGKPAAALTIAVGRDSRVSGETLQSALMAGLTATGVRVLDCGLCTTPAMFMTTALLGADGAAMVTASHLPWRRNGYKFFTTEGGLSGADITEILQSASESPCADMLPRAEPVDFLAIYAGFLSNLATSALGRDKPLAGLRVAVDAGNGAGGFYAALLESLGADTRGSRFLEPDGMFPNHVPNPEDPQAMEALADATRCAGADLGVIFDADCDRMALADGEGNPVNRNRLIALISAVLLRETPGATIVTDSVTSAGLKAFLASRGGVLHRFKRGYHNVIHEAKRLNGTGVDCPLAIETSGHAALRENRFLDDGMYLATRLLIEAARMKREGKALCDAISDLSEPAESREIRVRIHAEPFAPAGEAAIARLTEAVPRVPGWAVDPDNREGIRVSCGGEGNWFLLRLSLHDPLLVLNAESDHAGGVGDMLSALKRILDGCEGIGEMPLTD